MDWRAVLCCHRLNGQQIAPASETEQPEKSSAVIYGALIMTYHWFVKALPWECSVWQQGRPFSRRTACSAILQGFIKRKSQAGQHIRRNMRHACAEDHNSALNIFTDLIASVKYRTYNELFCKGLQRVGDSTALAFKQLNEQQKAELTAPFTTLTMTSTQQRVMADPAD